MRMDEAIRAAITAIECEIDVLDRRRDEYSRALLVLREMDTTPTDPPKATGTDIGEGSAPLPVDEDEETAVEPLPLRTPRQVVQVRDTTILAHLRRHGPATTYQLVAIMPPERGQTEAKRVFDCKNALTRMRVKRLIVPTKTGWAIA